MSLSDRLRDAGEALFTAYAHDGDIERGAQLLNAAYQNFRPAASGHAEPWGGRVFDDFDDDEAIYALGTVCAQRRDWHGAALCFHQAAVHDFADAALRLGEVLEQLDRLDEAMQWYQQAEQSGLSEGSDKLATLTAARQEPRASADRSSATTADRPTRKTSQTAVPMERTTSQPVAEKQQADAAPVLPLVARDRGSAKDALPGVPFHAATPSKSWEYYSETSLALDESSSGGRNKRSLSYPPASLLGRLSDRTREDFLAVGVSESRPAGMTLIQQGESDSSALLLLHGAVKVQATNPSEGRILLAIRVGGDLVGEAAALDGGPRLASVVSSSDIFFKRMTQAELRTFLARHPDAAIEVASMISERLRWANRRRIEHGLPASMRVARVLVDLYEAHGSRAGKRWDLGVPLTREELASMAGIKLSTAERVVRSLQEDGLVSGRYRGIAILDMTELRVRAETTGT